MLVGETFEKVSPEDDEEADAFTLLGDDVLQPALVLSSSTLCHNRPHEMKIVVPSAWRAAQGLSPQQIFAAGLSARACRCASSTETEARCVRCGHVFSVELPRSVDAAQPPPAQGPQMLEEYAFLLRPHCSSTRNHFGGKLVVAVALAESLLLLSEPFVIRSKQPSSPSSSLSPASKPQLSPPPPLPPLSAPSSSSSSQQQQQRRQLLLGTEAVQAAITGSPTRDAPVTPYNAPLTLVTLFGTTLSPSRCAALLAAFVPVISREVPGFTFATFVPALGCLPPDTSCLVPQLPHVSQQDLMRLLLRSENPGALLDPRMAGTFPLFTIGCFSSINDMRQGGVIAQLFCSDLFTSGAITILAKFQSW